MWRFVYSTLLLAAWPWVHVRLRRRARREPAYGERIPERFGHLPAGIPRGCVWFHTVSAGETIAAAPLIAALVRTFPDVPFLVTTMTPSGSAEVRRRLGSVVHHCYAPYDFPASVRRFLDAVEPSLLVLMETELWPNLIALTARRDAPVMLVNGRLSAASARGYRRLGALTRPMLTAMRWIACQSAADARRFVALGAPEERVVVHGSVKFDAALPEDHAERVAELAGRWMLAGVPVWIAASTHPGEEAVALDAHRRLRGRWPDVRLILVPRHPPRADEVVALCRRAGFSVSRHSQPSSADMAADVIVGDTMGELIYLYGLADAAFVGGSLCGHGGHNPIEPALCGVPAVTGPDVFNFADVVGVFRAAGCLAEVSDAAGLASVLDAWLSDDASRADLGRRALAVVTENRGAVERLTRLLEAEIRHARRRPPGTNTAQ